jgi:hypothetical protein
LVEKWQATDVAADDRLPSLATITVVVSTKVIARSDFWSCSAC